MNAITLPFWIFALSIGVPCVTLIGLVAYWLRNIRNPKKDMFVIAQHPEDKSRKPTAQQFHNDLLSKQIDTIFNGMNAIIETERLKVKALLDPDHNVMLETTARPMPAQAQRQTQAPSVEIPEATQPEEPAPSLEQQIVNLASSGEQIEDIASELGLSQTEIDLAMQMRSSRDAHQGRKLEAVA